MRIIPARKIQETVAQLCVKANTFLRSDVSAALNKAARSESNSRAKSALRAIIANARIAKTTGLAICQDTGLPTIYVELGDNVRVTGSLPRAIQRGVEQGYRRGYLRNSIVRDPLQRSRPGYGPAVVHYDVVPGDKISLTVLPKGFGCENKSALKMFLPTAPVAAIKEFILNTVKAAGADACPPYVVGVGIGGTADYACVMAKKALLRRLAGAQVSRCAGKPVSRLAGFVGKLEQELLKEINRLNIGPMGLGGKTTALAVHIATYPTHIAGLPVAVSISCHALRSSTAII